MRRPSDYESPGCREVGGDWWFPDPGCITVETRMAIAICNSCVHKQECLEWAITNHELGIWGGTAEYQRAAIRRQRGIAIGGANNA